MLAMLAEPFAKYIAAAVAVLALAAGVAFYVHSVKVSGMEQERAAEAAVSANRQLSVAQNDAAIDASVAKIKDPQSALKFEWERHDDK